MGRLVQEAAAAAGEVRLEPPAAALGCLDSGLTGLAATPQQQTSQAGVVLVAQAAIQAELEEKVRLQPLLVTMVLVLVAGHNTLGRAARAALELFGPVPPAHSPTWRGGNHVCPH